MAKFILFLKVSI